MTDKCSLLTGTLPEIVNKCAGNDQKAAVFDQEKITFTFADVKKEVNNFLFFFALKI